MSDSVKKLAEAESSPFVLVSAQVESELCGFNLDERAEYMEQLEVTDEDFGLPVSRDSNSIAWHGIAQYSTAHHSIA
jgi:hypothetical protein